jgi:murein DD-endopeptidase MepM/ murein hydrolase activator NlpD
MAKDRRRATVALLLAAASAAGMLVAPSSQAQENPIEDLFTTTTKAPATTATTAAPPSSEVAPAQEAPAGAEDPQGDGAPAPEQGIVVPPEAQRIIDSVQRTGSNSNAPLLTALSELVALGMTEAEAHRLGLGRFPVAGPARYSHDWLYPRYGPGFRFHLGTDVFAAHGTPLRAPVDGVATSGQDALGGLWVKVQMPDRTYFYLAHLAGLVEGFTEGMAVRTGDIVGYVGDSGNAKGGSPHVHVGVYPKGGAAVDPKPILDQFLVEAAANVPKLVEAWKAAHPSSAPVAVPLLPVDAEARLLRPTLATQLVHPYASGGDGWTPAVLYVLGADPSAGAGYLLQSSLDALAAGIDWSER